jgi:hypothetical protein
MARGKRNCSQMNNECPTDSFDILGKAEFWRGPHLFPLEAAGIRGRNEEDYPTPKTSVLGRAARRGKRAPIAQYQQECNIGENDTAFEYGLMGLGNSQMRVMDRATTNGNTPFDINQRPFNDEVTFPWIITQVVTQETYRQFDAAYPDFWERE